MNTFADVGKIVNGLIAQTADYGLWHTFRQNYIRRISPSYKVLVERSAPEWLNDGCFVTQGGLSTHMLLCARDLTMGLCAAASFVRCYGNEVSLFFHDDGSLQSYHVDYIYRIFPQSRVILRAESNTEIDNWLSNCPFSRSLRRQCFMLVKFFDPIYYGSGDWRLLLDSDVMFFRSPDMIKEIVSGGVPCNWFNRDIASSYCVDPARAEALLGRPVVERLNAGLALVHRNSVRLDKCDEYLAACDFVARPWVIEQTLHAMFATVFGAKHLPDEYELNSSRFATRNAVTKHYVGRMTEMFFLDGFKRVSAKAS